MHIRQITSKVVSEKYVGKWYCADSVPGCDGDPVNRYLRADGSWGKTTHYFDSKEAVEQALAVGHKPDFTMSEQELFDRETIRHDVEASMWDDYDDQ